MRFKSHSPPNQFPLAAGGDAAVLLSRGETHFNLISILTILDTHSLPLTIAIYGIDGYRDEMYLNKQQIIDINHFFLR